MLPRFLLTVLFTALTAPGMQLCAQETRPIDDSPPHTDPNLELLLRELDSRRPDEGSPFFAEPQVDRYLDFATGRTLAQRQGVPTYPNIAPPEGPVRTLARFYRTIVRDLPFRKKSEPFVISLDVIPSASFLLSDRREITATLTFKNTSKELTRLFFPTSQRFDFTITDEVGAVIFQWSKDRVFDEVQGIVLVNPDEIIKYEVTLPTAGMEAGKTYTLRAQIAENPQYSQSIQLFPR
jgi:hypothetical protein